MSLANAPDDRAAGTPVHAPVRPFASGVLLVLLAFAIVWATGALAPDALLGAASGAGFAVLVAGAVVLVQPAMLRHAGKARSPGLQLQLALGVAFVFKLLGLVLAVVVLVVAGVKFTDIASFAVSFAAASLVLQVCHAALSARGLNRAVTGQIRTDLNRTDSVRTDPSR
jgi:hypothetical protein